MKKYIVRSFLIFILLLSNTIVNTQQKPTIAVIGTGYVGLVLGVCLAHSGNHVICADIQKNKIDQLSKGISPIYEPGLEELLRESLQKNTISFTTDTAQAIRDADIVFIAVDTPTKTSGESDLTALINVTHTIAQNLTSYKIICIKSTAPIGTCTYIKELIKNSKNSSCDFDMACNPEFLREGTAVHDFLNPDRIILGTDSEKVSSVLREIFSSFCPSAPVLTTNFETAEMIKYAANSFLATKISFINEIAHLCEALGAYVNIVAEGVGLDKRIGKSFFLPGPGFGGSCFPKDVTALLHMAQANNVDLKVVKACLDTNDAQKMHVVDKILSHCNGDVRNKTICILGLAFKANTDDVRFSPAITVIEQLTAHGAQVKVYDPKAMVTMKKVLPHIEYCASVEDALAKSDMVVIMTEWEEFKKLDLEKIKNRSHNPIIIDTRNILNTTTLRNLNFTYENIGNAQINSY